MKASSLLLALTALLSGCIIFDKKSEAVTFHQLASPTAASVQPKMQGTHIFLPRAIIPSALRRPNVVLLDDNGWVRIEDAHRWISPLDRAIPEVIGRHVSARTGIVADLQTPLEEHLVLLLTVDKMEVFAPAGPERSLFSLPGSAADADTATLQLTCRLEKSDGTLMSVKSFTQSRPLKERTPVAFVQAQSANLAAIAVEIARWVSPPTPSK